MNNKGFTVVELLASFTLTMIIVVFLFEIVLELKDVYTSDAIKTKILSQNALIATALNKKLNSGIITASCSERDCGITYSDSTIDIIKVTTDKVIIGNQTFSMPENSYIMFADENYHIQSEQLGDNSYIKIAYTVGNDNLKKPIKFSYVYMYSDDYDSSNTNY